jgi:hypothetical protein
MEAERKSKKIFIISSVRGRSARTDKFLDSYVESLESRGYNVHYPKRDVDQTDDGCGLKICQAHRAAMKKVDEVHVLWNPDSKGSHFDFGMAFMVKKKIRLIHIPKETRHKSYTNVLIKLHIEGL